MPRNILQAAAFLLGFGAMLFLASLVAPSARGDAGVGSEFAALEAQLLAGVNAIRAEHHLIPLERSAALDEVARGHSNDMAQRNYLSHENPEGKNPVDRIQHGDVSDGYTLAAENLGKTNRADPNQEMLRSWLASAEHRRNLLTPPFNTTGIGIARGGDGSLIYTQLYVTYPR